MLRSAIRALRRHGITGHVDRIEGGDTLVGWAADLSTPGRRLAVECVHEGRVVATAVADRARDDLNAAGIGDGDYGFKLSPPPDAFVGATDPAVSVRVQGTSHWLRPEQVRLRMDVFLWFVAADIVNNCNLRCPFCIFDYSDVTKTEVMSEQTFRKLLRLAPSVPDGQFYISCLHEPTLHPRLNAFLTLIPVDARKKVFFTTNLARPLKQSDFEAWAGSGLHHINVSLDTLDPSRFAVLRKHGRLDVFMANLDRLAETFARASAAPPLHFITMAFQSNLDEIPEVVRVSRERWGARANDVRYTFDVAHIPDAFRKAEYLRREDWDRLAERLGSCGYPVTIAFPPADRDGAPPERSPDFFRLREPAGPPARLTFTRPMGLRVASDGTVLVSDAEDALRVNINSLEDPPHFFRSLLRHASPRTDGAVLLT